MANVKTGDFTKIVSVSDPSVVGNIGKIVLVGKVHHTLPQLVWNVELLDSAIVVRGKISRTAFPGFKAVCADRHLKRIDPPQEDEETKQEKELTV